MQNLSVQGTHTPRTIIGIFQSQTIRPDNIRPEDSAMTVAPIPNTNVEEGHLTVVWCEDANVASVFLSAAVGIWATRHLWRAPINYERGQFPRTFSLFFCPVWVDLCLFFYSTLYLAPKK